MSRLIDLTGQRFGRLTVIERAEDYIRPKEEAIIARLKAEKEYYGEFAPQRNLWKEYGIEDD